MQMSGAGTRWRSVTSMFTKAYSVLICIVLTGCGAQERVAPEQSQFDPPGFFQQIIEKGIHEGLENIVDVAPPRYGYALGTQADIIYLIDLRMNFQSPDSPHDLLAEFAVFLLRDRFVEGSTRAWRFATMVDQDLSTLTVMGTDGGCVFELDVQIRTIGSRYELTLKGHAQVQPNIDKLEWQYRDTAELLAGYIGGRRKGATGSALNRAKRNSWKEDVIEGTGNRGHVSTNSIPANPETE